VLYGAGRCHAYSYRYLDLFLVVRRLLVDCNREHNGYLDLSHII
jgi:hypothetical protein